VRGVERRDESLGLLDDGGARTGSGGKKRRSERLELLELK
jgi:hypothetical protein